jgi:hypothetical protein
LDIHSSACLWFVTVCLINISKEDREIPSDPSVSALRDSRTRTLGHLLVNL